MAGTAANAFIGKQTEPADSDLAAALGSAKAAWDQLLAHLEAEGVTGREWKNYSAKSGWALRMVRGKRTIVWMAAHDGCFQVAFILGDKAVQAAREAGLGVKALKLLDEAPRYPEGTGVRLQVKSTRDLAVVRRLVAVKLQN
jgi:hypothetical protein